ncbi:MAG: 3-phosphoshikimate 1-carboxyvinyltransferase [Prevotellaceae bacterium]|jgi:3-phosphoshikimate 1-carboxyvinyltransferase|nr:3-phosphoshikimate 1-carboxyvinyltransferase [Prevotellaceae bacterium]
MNGIIELPISKSLANRILVIDALVGKASLPIFVKACADTQIMAQALSVPATRINVGASGTALRFLTAYMSFHSGRRKITGVERIYERPIAPLVDALKSLGAKIRYLGQEGFAPMEIIGQSLAGGKVQIDASYSSQFVSALMLIAPRLSNGLTIEVIGEPTSKSYIDMTAALMQRNGIAVTVQGRTVSVAEGKYTPVQIVEYDWTAASYWYSILAIQKQGKILLKNLNVDSLQGDRIVSTLFEPFGVATTQTPDGVRIEACSSTITSFAYNFQDCPDLVPTFTVLCCALKIPFCMTGIIQLQYKESARVEVLMSELQKCGYQLHQPTPDMLVWQGKYTPVHHLPQIDPHNDHRIAMAFAPLHLNRSVVVNMPSVVDKSYPDFWELFED